MTGEMVHGRYFEMAAGVGLADLDGDMGSTSFCDRQHLEATVVRKGKRTVVHLLSYLPCRRTDRLDIVEDPFPIVDMPLWVKLPKKPTRAYLAPAGTELECDYEDGYAHVRVTEMDGHVMVVFE